MWRHPCSILMAELTSSRMESISSLTMLESQWRKRNQVILVIQAGLVAFWPGSFICILYVRLRESQTRVTRVPKQLLVSNYCFKNPTFDLNSLSAFFKRMFITKCLKGFLKSYQKGSKNHIKSKIFCLRTNFNQGLKGDRSKFQPWCYRSLVVWLRGH